MHKSKLSGVNNPKFSSCLFKGLVLFLILVSVSITGLVFADISYTVTLELDETQVYPGQDVQLSAVYVSSYPEDEEGWWYFEDYLPDVTISTSGLIPDFTTPILLPLGEYDYAGLEYDFAETTLSIPLETTATSHEGYYDVYTNGPIVSNRVTINVRPVDEEITLTLDQQSADPGDSISYTVTYKLLTPNVFLRRPLSTLYIESEILDETISVPVSVGEVASGLETVIASGTIPIKDDAEKGSYSVKASASPPSLESNLATINVQTTSSDGQSEVVSLFTRWDLWAGVTVLGGSLLGASYVINKTLKKPAKTKSSKQLLLSDPINNKGWRVAELNPDGSVKEGTIRTLSDDEVENIRRVTRVIDGSKYDDLEWTDPKTGDTITWRGPDEIASTPPPQPVQKPSADQPKKTVKPKKKKKPAKKPKVSTSKKPVKPVVKPVITPVPPPPVVAQQPPQVKPKMKKWEQKLQSGVDMVNQSLRGDTRVQRVLNNYKGRRYVIEVKGEGTYALDVRSDGLVMKRNVVPKKSDGYIRMKKREMSSIFKTLKQYQEYSRYKDNPSQFKKKPKEVTKRKVLTELGGIISTKLTFSIFSEDRPIKGIGLQDLSILKEILIPKKGAS